VIFNVERSLLLLYLGVLVKCVYVKNCVFMFSSSSDLRLVKENVGRGRFRVLARVGELFLVS
jgi:hypothetical protein